MGIFLLVVFKSLVQRRNVWGEWLCKKFSYGVIKSYLQGCKKLLIFVIECAKTMEISLSLMEIWTIGRDIWKRYLIEMKIAMRAEMFCEWKQLGAVGFDGK